MASEVYEGITVGQGTLHVIWPCLYLSCHDFCMCAFWKKVPQRSKWVLPQLCLEIIWGRKFHQSSPTNFPQSKNSPSESVWPTLYARSGNESFTFIKKGVFVLEIKFKLLLCLKLFSHPLEDTPWASFYNYLFRFRVSIALGTHGWLWGFGLR